jgi:3-keto-5-aminohexanoate cleavage enzyme
VSRTIVLAVAPVGGWGAGRNNPLTPGQIAREVASCAEAGASLVHLHARDRRGGLTTDLETYSAACEKIRAECDILIEASTGGLSSLSAAERALSLNSPHAELGSLNLGSLNFHDQVYCNSMPDIRLWIAAMRDRQVKPQLEIFDTAQVQVAEALAAEGLLQGRMNFNFIFNYRWGMCFSLPLLQVLAGMLPPESIWGAVVGASEDFAVHLQAALYGAHMLRVGFEDSPLLAGREADTNAGLVSALVKQLNVLGFRPATVPEARRILGLKEV